MPDAVVHEELVKELKQAKQKARRFALIAKGAAPLHLIVQKKPIPAGVVLQAKSEFKGNAVIEGVVQGDGTELIFFVLGEEPALPVSKLKSYLAEVTGLPLKPRFAVVPVLPEVCDDDAEGQSAAGVQAASVPPAPLGPPALVRADAARPQRERVAALLTSLAPTLQQAMAAWPACQEELLAAAARAKELLSQSDATAAQEAVLHLARRAHELTGTAAGGLPDGKLSVAALGKARLEWLTVRQQALADMHRLKDAITAEFRDDTEQAAALREALATLDGLMQRIDVQLAEQLDAVLNADAAARPPLVAQVRTTLAGLQQLLADPVMEELDGNEVLPDMLVAAPIRAKLVEISAALGS
jgi:hypothetical protein